MMYDVCVLYAIMQENKKQKENYAKKSGTKFMIFKTGS